jgi:hypothetical protein
LASSTEVNRREEFQTHLDILRNVKLEQHDPDERKADHEVPRVLFSLNKFAVAGEELVAETLEGWSRVRHEVVEKDVDGVADGLRVRFEGDVGEDTGRR